MPKSSDNGQTVPPTSYTEYLQCDFGEAYSPEAFRHFLPIGMLKSTSYQIAALGLWVFTQSVVLRGF